MLCFEERKEKCLFAREHMEINPPEQARFILLLGRRRVCVFVLKARLQEAPAVTRDNST